MVRLRSKNDSDQSSCSAFTTIFLEVASTKQVLKPKNVFENCPKHNGKFSKTVVESDGYGDSYDQLVAVSWRAIQFVWSSSCYQFVSLAGSRIVSVS